MIIVEVKRGFYDVQEKCWRAVDSEFEVTEERFKELQERLPGFVEKKKDKKVSKKEEVTSDEQPN